MVLQERRARVGTHMLVGLERTNVNRYGHMLVDGRHFEHRSGMQCMSAMGGSVKKNNVWHGAHLFRMVLGLRARYLLELC